MSYISEPKTKEFNKKNKINIGSHMTLVEYAEETRFEKDKIGRNYLNGIIKYLGVSDIGELIVEVIELDSIQDFKSKVQITNLPIVFTEAMWSLFD